MAGLARARRQGTRLGRRPVRLSAAQLTSGAPLSVGTPLRARGQRQLVSEGSPRRDGGSLDSRPSAADQSPRSWRAVTDTPFEAR